MNSKIDFVNGKTGTSLLKMVMPLLMAMFLTMAYNMVDSLWVGNLLGENAYAALADSTALILILNAIAMGAGNGIAILIAHVVGAGEKQKAERMVGVVVFLSVLFSLQTPQEIFNDAYGYLSIYLLGYVFLYLYVQFTSIFRAYGDPMLQMKGMFFTTLFNAVIDPFLIRLMGLNGAAWATVLSEVLCLGYAILYYRKKKLFSIDMKGIWKEHAYVTQILSDAIPSALQQCMPAISSAVMVVLVSSFGVTSIAAYGVTNKLEIFLFYPAMAMNMALVTSVGQCAGAGRIDRVKDYMKFACLIGSIFVGVVSVLIILFAGQLSHLFVPADAAAEIVKRFFSIISIGYVMYMLTSCFLGELSGLGKSGFSMLLFFVYYIVVRVPLASVFVRTSLGLDGIWVSILISHVLAAVLAGIVAVKNLAGDVSVFHQNGENASD